MSRETTSRDQGTESATRQPAVELHPETWVALENCGPPRPYTKTFSFAGDYINEYHRKLSVAPTGRMGIAVCIDLGIDGYLQRPDAMKIYELAYFSGGDVLELGTHKGLSASIIARALDDSGTSHKLETDDIDKTTHPVAKKNLAGNPGLKRVNFNLEDANNLMDRYIAKGRKFGFIFVDHWHGYAATHDAALRVHSLLIEGGFVLFHDYNDVENADPAHDHKVYPAVTDTLAKDSRFRFCAVCGCCGLYQKIS